MSSRLDVLAFRPATASDAPLLAALVAERFDAYRAFAPPRWSPPTVAEETGVTATLAQPSAWCHVEDEGQRLAGHAGWLAAADGRRPSAEVGLAHLWRLFVRPDWWGRGLASRLHDTALDAAVQRGLTTMRLHTPISIPGWEPRWASGCGSTC